MSVTQNYQYSVAATLDENNNLNGSLILTDGIDYEIQNRTLIPINIQTDVAVAGDNNSQIIGITIDRFFDNIDLSTKNIQIVFENAEGETGVYDVTDYGFFEDKLNLYWLIDSRLTKVEGQVRFQVRFITFDDNNNYNYLWQSKIQIFNILPKIDILDDALPIDYSKEIELIKENPTSAYFKITDEDIPVDVTSRTIGQLPREIVVRGDSCSQLLSFKIPFQIEGVLVNTKLITIKFINANGEGDRSVAVNVVENAAEGYVTFGWLIDSKATAASGKLQFAIELIGYLDDEQKKFYAWQTKTASTTVLNSIVVEDFMEDPGPTWLQAWTIESQQVLKLTAERLTQATSQADRAELMASNAASSADDALAYQLQTEQFKQDVENLKQDTINSANAAESARAVAEELRDETESFRNEGERFREDTLVAKDAAESAQLAAEFAQSEAEDAESVAKQAKADAESARNAAQESQAYAKASETIALDAKEDAEEAKTLAENHKITATNAKTAAEIAQKNAEIAEQNAETAQAVSEATLAEIQSIRRSLMAVEEF